MVNDLDRKSGLRDRLNDENEMRSKYFMQSCYTIILYRSSVWKIKMELSSFCIASVTGINHYLISVINK